MRKQLFVWFFMVLTVSGAVAFAQKVSSGKKSVPPEVSQVGTRFAAVLMPPNGEIVRGHTDIEAFWKKLIEQGLNVSTDTIEASASGSIGYEAGTYELSIQPAEGQAIHDKGKYVNLMKRGADGHWRMVFDIWNSSLPAAPTK
jgi:ketosteroid isomerase-like protein